MALTRLHDAFAAAIGDLAIGLALGFSALVLIAVLLYLEVRDDRLSTKEPAEVEYVDPWASLPPKWHPPRAESDLGDRSDRWAA